MNAALAPNIEAFRAYLKTRADQKKRATGVTRVTAMKSDTYQLHDFVTRVTEGITGDQDNAELLERQAIAEIDGHIPPVFSLAFAAFQMGCPSDRTTDEWHCAIDDAGRFLDSYGQQAAALGWQANDLFAADGLAWALQGADVAALTSSTATLTDSRAVRRSR
jgi:hypothetical protein